MSDFIYIKGEGKSKWKLIPNTQLDLEEGIRQGARFHTVLSVDKDVDAVSTGLDADAKVNYKGPLYFDLDSGDDLEAAIEDLKRLLISLYFDYGVRLSDIRIWASGGKGFHVLVPAKIFSKGKASTVLGYTYKNMALAFDLTTLDFGIYSQGKGRMWRIENLKRPNGTYKTQITAADALSMSLERLAEVVSRPGMPTLFPDNVDYAPELAALFASSKFKPRKLDSIADEKLVALAEDPECIQALLKLERVSSERNFNQVVMSLAGYFCGRGLDEDQFIAKVDYVCEHGVSSVYKTPNAKERHMRSLFRFFQAKQDYRFTCDFARKCVEDLKCAICPANSKAKGSDELGIEEIGGCYFQTTNDGGLKRISTFKIVPVKEVLMVDGGHVEHCLNTILLSDTGEEASVVFYQGDWASKSALLKKLPNPRHAFWGGDDTVQKIANQLMRMEIPKQKGVRVVGMHYYDKAWHFVTKDGSISADRSKNDELMLPDDVAFQTDLLGTTPATRAELQAVADHIWRFNDLTVAVPILGWYISCFYKERIFAKTKQFPLLFVFGEAGAGKTLTTLALRRLFAVGEDVSLRNVGDQTKFTLIKAVSGTNTVPVFFDEFKGTQFSSWQRKNITSLIRAAYNNEMAERGKADQTVQVYAYKAPIAFTGEQIITEAAVRDRIIEVQMTRSLSKPHEERYHELSAQPLEKVGRLLLEDALSITDEELQEILDKELADMAGFEDRPRLNYSIMFAGLALLERLFKKYNITHDLSKAKAEYKVWRKARHVEEGVEFRKTDIDRILETMALMTQGDRLTLFPGEHFRILGDKLIINMRLCHSYFIKYVKEFGVEDVEPIPYAAFLKLIRQEEYFIAQDVRHKLGNADRLCCELSIPKMSERRLSLIGLIDAEEPIDRPEVEFG